VQHPVKLRRNTEQTFHTQHTEATRNADAAPAAKWSQNKNEPPTFGE